MAGLLIWLLLAPQHKTHRTAPKLRLQRPRHRPLLPQRLRWRAPPRRTHPLYLTAGCKWRGSGSPRRIKRWRICSAILEWKKSNAMYPCWVVNKEGLHCETQKAATWDDFKRFNRPAVLSLTTKSRQAGYVALIGVDGLKGNYWSMANANASV